MPIEVKKQEFEVVVVNNTRYIFLGRGQYEVVSDDRAGGHIIIRDKEEDLPF